MAGDLRLYNFAPKDNADKLPVRYGKQLDSFSTHLTAKTQMLPTVEPHLFFDAAGFQSIQAHCCQVISVCLNATCKISLAEL